MILFYFVLSAQKKFFNQLTCWLSNTNLIPRETLGLRCAHIAELITHAANSHMPVYLAIILVKSLDILQKVIKSQKVHHISKTKQSRNKKLKFKRFLLKILFLYFWLSN